MNKRDMALGLLAGVAGAGLIGSKAFAAAATEADAVAAIMTWLDALRTGDAAKIDAVLAAEFQIQRSDGTGFDKKSYLSNLPKHVSEPQITDLAFGSNGDKLVTRYNLKIEQKINNKPVQGLAPRLSVFRHDGSGWLISAHANFAQIG
jgi:hypothetical protein